MLLQETVDELEVYSKFAEQSASLALHHRCLSDETLPYMMECIALFHGSSMLFLPGCRVD